MITFIEDIKNIKSAIGELRKFGIIVGIVLGLLGLFFLSRQGDCAFYFFIISAVLISATIISPITLKPVQKAWMSLAIIIGFFATRLILSILFYLVATPTGILARLFGKDFLNTDFDKNAKSYWVPKK